MPLTIAPSNPVSNVLPQAIPEEKLIQAIEASGYPLQGLVAHELTRHFVVTEEWGYLDRDTREHRSLDLSALCPIGRPDQPDHLNLALLAECKRTGHVHVFFQQVTGREIPDYPSIPGLPTVSVSWGNQSRDVHPSRILGLSELPFLSGPDAPPVCASFVKGHRQNEKVEFSGAEPFNSLVLPLVKAHDSASEVARQWGTNRVCVRATLLLSLAVIDGPMVLIERPDAADQLLLVPWVRVVRQEVNRDPRAPNHFHHYAIDVVHFGFLKQYVERHLLPFAEAFADRVARMRGVLFHGAVAASDSWKWTELKPRSAGQR
jgi:hypothetical protein